jgi:hypothetical protein
MFEGGPLKVREHAAFGLPLILACRDVDAPEDAPYALYIPNTEDNIAMSLPAIRDFVEKWRGRRVPRERVAHMDWAVKEQKRLEKRDDSTGEGIRSKRPEFWSRPHHRARISAAEIPALQRAAGGIRLCVSQNRRDLSAAHP